MAPTQAGETEVTSLNNENTVVTEGSTVEEAVKKALNLLQASEDEVEIVVENPPRKGFLGLWNWRARVRVRRIEKSHSETTESEAATSDVDTEETGSSAADAEMSTDASSGMQQEATIAVRDGKVYVSTPEGRSGDPVIRPSEYTNVWVNDELLDGPQIVTDVDVIRIKAVDEPPETTVDVHISHDKYTASISVFLKPGIRYELIDTPPLADVTVQARPGKVLQPQLPTVATLRNALTEHGVVHGISAEALNNFVRLLEEDPSKAEQPVPVAFGTPMEPTVGESVELQFDPAARVRTELEDHRTDLLGLYKLSSVKAGDVLGIKRPGRKGTPGKTVTGDVVPVSEPKAVEIRAGEGAAWDEDGSRLLATRGGRPTKVRNVISVNTKHTVMGDVDPSTGHIEFDGDVVVTGNVGDSMRIVSKASVSIANRVSNAVIEADESVTIGRGIVGSKVIAGAQQAQLLQLIAYFQPISDDLSRLIRAVQQVKAQMASTTARQLSDGNLVKRLLDDRFAGTVRRVRELNELIQQRDELPDPEIAQFAFDLQGKLIGLGPLSLRDLAEVVQLQRQAAEYADLAGTQQTAAFDIVTGFVDNSELLAAGQIELRSGGCSYSRLWAGTGVTMQSGVFRGTSMTVHQGDVDVKEAGSRASAPVQIEIVTKGQFRARLVHPGVVVAIGNQRYAFRNEERNVRVRLVDGELKVDFV